MFFEIFKDTDLIIHAGDITQQSVIDELRGISPVTAVLGNNGRLELKKSEVIEVFDFKIAVNHGTDCSGDFDRLKRFALQLKSDILITGHTHTPHFEIIDDIMFVNPGSSNRPIKSDASVGLLEINQSDVSVDDIEVKFIEL